MYNPQAAQMSTYITIKNFKETIVDGNSVISYVDAVPPGAFCNWKSKGGTQVITDAISVIDTAELIMWYRPDVSATDRIIMDGKTYDVISVENIEMRNYKMILRVQRAEVG